MKKPLASEMAWGEGTLKKCESPEDERHHPQRKGNEALINYSDVQIGMKVIKMHMMRIMNLFIHFYFFLVQPLFLK